MEIELGIVSSVEIDGTTCKARVQMTTRDNAVSPPLFETLAILGRERTLQRLALAQEVELLRRSSTSEA